MMRCWLAPLNPLYSAALALQSWRIDKGWKQVRRLDWPVVSIGNLSVGGSGKTPLTIALAQALIAQGFHVDVLSRGYGRTSKGAVRVLPHGATKDFGDEPLLIAQQTDVPVYVAAERYEAGLLAEAAYSASHSPAVHLLDDGFQHRPLYRTVDILLLNRRDWNDHLLPAGNLRESIRAIHRASVIAIPCDELELEDNLRRSGFNGPLWRLQRKMEVPTALKAEGANARIAAFCGIAHPDQFFNGSAAEGLLLVTRIPFADHHGYTARDLNHLLTAARAADATALLTTEKDLVRLGPNAAAFLTATLPLYVATLRTEIEDASAALAWLVNRLK